MGSVTNERRDWNCKIVEEFRANGGRVGGDRFDGQRLLLLHTRDARTGEPRVNPLIYQQIGHGRLAVFASDNDAPTDPDWYDNLIAHPNVAAEIGTGTRRYLARTAAPEERGPIWTKLKHDNPGVAVLDATTD